jgi:hypothetical protein
VSLFYVCIYRIHNKNSSNIRYIVSYLVTVPKLTLLRHYAVSPYKRYADTSLVLRELNSVYTIRNEINSYLTENMACFHYKGNPVNTV